MRVLEVKDNDQFAREAVASNSLEWGRPLTAEDHITREFVLRDRLRAAGLGHRSYVLVDDSENVLASCECMSRPAYARDESGQGHEITEYCLASVFCPPQFRRKGYAKALVTELAEELAQDGAVTLWSDVGDYYSRSGFVFPEFDACGSACGEATPNTGKLPHDGEFRNLVWRPSADVPWPSGVEQLDIVQSRLLANEHKQLLIRALEHHGKAGFVTLPHEGLYDQLQHRAEVVAEMLKLPPLEVYGARTSNGHGWAVWTYLVADHQLAIYAIHGSADEIATLVTVAGAAAAGWRDTLGVFTVVIYQSSLIGADISEVLAAVKAQAPGVELEMRKGSLPMYRYSVPWLFPGKYAWY